MNRYTDGKVTTPINVADLSQLLNRSQEDINKVEYSNLLTSVGGLCKHPNINIWSKYRPMLNLPMGRVTLAQRNSVNYGLHIPYYTSFSEFESAFRNNSTDWTAVLPTGGVTSPYSLAHFLSDEIDDTGSYDHISANRAWGAGNTLDNEYGYGKYAALGVFHRKENEPMFKNEEILVMIDYNDSDSSSVTSVIQMADIKDVMLGNTPIGSCYLGVALIETSGKYASYWCTSQYNLENPNDGGHKVIIHLPSIQGKSDKETKTWHLVPILSSVCKPAINTINESGSFCIIGESKYFMTFDFVSKYEPATFEIEKVTNTAVIHMNTEDAISNVEMWVAFMHHDTYGLDQYLSEDYDTDRIEWLNGGNPYSNKYYYGRQEYASTRAAYITQATLDDNGQYIAVNAMTTDGYGNELTEGYTYIHVFFRYTYNGETISGEVYTY